MITGASRGIGRALAEALLARGDQVLATTRVPSDLGDLAGRPGLTVLTMDVSSTSSVAEARKACDIEALDVLVQNAGMSGGAQHAPGMDLARAETILSVNAMGPLRVYDAFVDLLRKGEGRKLVNVSSEAGSLARFRASRKPEYAMSKAALNALTLWIAATDPEVLAVSIDPGWTQTATGGKSAPFTPEQTAARLVSVIDRLSAEHRGGFFDSDLRAMAW
jgi:NAD(P)-dependent dehydrogenase (short-subunit alcohol dehydrogenase family)